MDRKKNLAPVLLAAALIIIIVFIILIGRIIDKYTPSKEMQNLEEYYGVAKEDEVAIVYNNTVMDQKAVFKGGLIYLDYQTVRDLLNSRFYWDANENLLLYTTPTDVISAAASSKDYFITKEKVSENYTIVYADTTTAYISIDYVQKFTDMKFEFYEEPKRVTLTTKWDDYQATTIKKDTEIRLKGGIKSPILANLEKGTEVRILEEGEDWNKAVTQNGMIGYVPSKRCGKLETKSLEHKFEEPVFNHLLKDGKINMAWHQVTSQDANATVSNVVSNTKGLNVISPTWFYLNDNDGNMVSLANADYVNYCHQNGIEVWALVSNLENNEVDTTQVLTYTSKRTKIVNELIASAIQYNFDGINVDFESLSQDAGEAYLQFIRELSLKCENNGIRLSVDNYVPTEYTAFYNRAEQAKFADYVVIMGYDEHYAGSEEEGSVASIGFVTKGVDDTLKEVPANQTILGAPLYTRVWIQTPKDESGDTVESASDDYVPYELTSQAVGMQEGFRMAEQNGAVPEWSEADGQYYAEYVNEGKTYKIWLEDVTSMEKRLQVASERGLAGMSFWKLGFEDATLWDTVLKYMN